jgi:outer membrane protein OmpA-like peptidoglycan-associated protein
MKSIVKKVAVTVSFAALAACSDNTTGFQEAGKFLDEGGFGNPTMQNLQAMTSEQSFAIALTRKFASDVDPTVNFAFNSSALDAQAKAILNRQANWMKQFPEARFRVFGHTDLVGTEAYNQALGLRRANAVVNYLISQGISRDRLEGVISKGKDQPLINTPDRERRNRRATTEVGGFSKKYAGELEGKYAAVIWRDYIASAGTQATSGGASAPKSGG